MDEQKFTVAYKVFWQGTDLMSYWSYYLPEEIQDLRTAADNLANDRITIVKFADLDNLRVLAFMQNPEAQAVQS